MDSYCSQLTWCSKRWGMPLYISFPTYTQFQIYFFFWTPYSCTQGPTDPHGYMPPKFISCIKLPTMSVCFIRDTKKKNYHHHSVYILMPVLASKSSSCWHSPSTFPCARYSQNWACQLQRVCHNCTTDIQASLWIDFRIRQNSGIQSTTHDHLRDDFKALGITKE